MCGVSPSHANLTLVNPATARQTLKQFWRPPGKPQSVFGGRYRDSRVFLAAAMLTLESLWGRVVLACYTGLLGVKEGVLRTSVDPGLSSIAHLVVCDRILQHVSNSVAWKRYESDRVNVCQ
ncbi:hypothetical protein PoB_006052900 [Plakobranchus ocellatus]|uniref:Uncharacterized protein n=1 Tax=Plakobranchus ocellatus TaxID=259542 RepID=A0AAV4CQ59_9GAST|nr:hypothetical protein PoB_006052900 [Plakobranchus ocellatus]